jgi:4-hydroxy-tetrahydrodipicolinate reductase
MGRALVHAIHHQPGAQLVAALDRDQAPESGLDAGSLAGLPALGVVLSSDIDEALRQADVLIDFTRPEGTLAALAACRRAGKPMVIGTTGFTPEQKMLIAEASCEIGICQAANFSVGVNVLLKLVEDAARTLGDLYDVEIVEVHHRHKVDAPSGTALALGESAARGLGRDLKSVAVYGREGHTGARETQAIGFATVRGGDVIGDHTVMYLGDGERLELSHKASSRQNFAAGAVRAAVWLARQDPGSYTMREVLGLAV